MQSCKHLCKVFSPSPSPLHTSPPLADLDIILHLQKEMAFSHHEHHLSFMDFALLPGTPAEMPFLQFYSSEDNNSHLPLSDAATLCASNSLDHECLKPPPVVDQAGEKSPRKNYGEKKRKINKDESSLITCQSKEEDKISKQKKPNSGFREANDKKTSSTCEELQAGYIHVRARRGEATDSHSLAERVRREKISERMKVLQSLVPGCEKVTGKALMLDEIINYVQSLQNQVEFLSMKLASFNPMLYFGADLDEYSNQPERMLRSTPLHVPISAAPTSHLENLAFEDGTGNCQMMGQWAHFALQGQGAISFPQDGSSDVYDQQHLLL